MTIKHVQENGPVRFRPNRDERRPPYLSNVVKGDCKQETPNGAAYGEPMEDLRFPGSRNGMPQSEPIPPWPLGYRSGE